VLVHYHESWMDDHMTGGMQVAGLVLERLLPHERLAETAIVESGHKLAGVAVEGMQLEGVRH
jgi:hypothetical protein